METSALVVLERAERAARERRLAAGLEAERRVAAARADAARIAEEAEFEAARASDAAGEAIRAAADREIVSLEAGAADAFRPDVVALAAARAFVVRALLGEVAAEAGPVGDDARARAPVPGPEG
jgi:hypothetical protein